MTSYLYVMSYKMIRKRSLETNTVQIRQSSTQKYCEFCFEIFQIYLEKSSKFASSTKIATVNYDGKNVNQNVCTKIMTMIQTIKKINAFQVQKAGKNSEINTESKKPKSQIKKIW